ncbi:hypothetical protein N1851_015920 [Merluccius polli]|uniref:Endonuclease/exonuclease/phosphatase domain-containing protein n=1 Tax=Merluccius polli TaxID=89951 RepID=A0AA47P297_MERPO|nr:hypothetical protein N1851_015920 [Merluccius polli]
MDILKTWFCSTLPDIVTISETWLKPSVPNQVIHIDGFNVYRTDRKGRGGGILMYVSEKFQGTVLHSISIPKQFEFLAVQLVVAGAPLIVIGCYRPPSATSDSISTLTNLLSKMTSSELLLCGDLNWDWLTEKSASFRLTCDDMNLTQLIDCPTRINAAKTGNDSLLDLFLTNAAHKFSAVGVFPNDLSDHCAIACVRNTRMPKMKGIIILRRCFKHFSEQAFLHDLTAVSWHLISAIPTINEAADFLHLKLLKVINQHAPLRKIRIKNRSNPWFSRELADALLARNKQWALARRSAASTDWLLFRILRNKCTALVRKSKTDYYLTLTSDSFNNHSKFWKTIKALQNKKATGPPNKLRVNNSFVTDKKDMSNAFNVHFKEASHIFDERHPNCNLSRDAGSPNPNIANVDATFNLNPFLVSEVKQALKSLDPRKTAGPDGLDPYLLKLAAPVLAQPVSVILNLSINTQAYPECGPRLAVEAYPTSDLGPGTTFKVD